MFGNKINALKLYKGAILDLEIIQPELLQMV
jgi:hypothetical protein